MSEECEPQNIVDTLEAIDNNDDKLKYVELVLKTCVKKKEYIPPKRRGRRKKMTSWLCYLKMCARETDMTYLECIEDKERADREYYPRKEYWEKKALEGCP